MQGRGNRDQGYSQRGSERFDRDESWFEREERNREGRPSRSRPEGQSFHNEQGRNENQWTGRSERGGTGSNEYEPNYSSYEPTYSNPERGYSSEQVYGRAERDRAFAGRAPWQDDRERERWSENRDRGYGAGISGQYFTRERSGVGGVDRDLDDARQRGPSQGRFEAGWGAGNRGVQAGGYGAAGYGSSEREGASPYGQSSLASYTESRHSRQDRDNRFYGAGGLQQGGFASPREGSHFGRGPKGYTRSDERIREDLSERLHDDHDVDASEVSIVVKDGEVTLTGTVENRRQKHRVEDIADAVSGVKIKG